MYYTCTIQNRAFSDGSNIESPLSHSLDSKGGNTDQPALFCKCSDILLLRRHGETSFLNQAFCHNTMSKEVNKLQISYSVNYITEVYSGINE
jgi:hypothetical protein